MYCTVCISIGASVDIGLSDEPVVDDTVVVLRVVVTVVVLVDVVVGGGGGGVVGVGIVVVVFFFLFFSDFAASHWSQLKATGLVVVLKTPVKEESGK